jgi:hypothetical protein
MICKDVQLRLLSSERPDLPPVDLKGHLVTCASCRALHRRLVRLEQQLPLLPVPPAPVPAALLSKILDAPKPVEAPAEAPILIRQRPKLVLIKERGLRKLALAFALAAAMVVFAIGWWAWPHAGPGPLPDTNVAYQWKQEFDQRVTQLDKEVGTPSERVKIVADLEVKLRGQVETLALANDRDGLAQLAGDYCRLIRDHLLKIAPTVPVDLRQGVLQDVVKVLVLAESEFKRKASDEFKSFAGPLGEMALAAQEGLQSLRNLVPSGNA